MLARAYRAAERGRGTVSPNPLVGCVVARGGEVVAEGHHERAGGPHAEVVALDAAGEAARGSDVFVTLEPCNHHGRTPPCVDRLLEAGVAAVTIGMPDPNPEVTGRGADALAAAGVRVAWAEDPAPFESLNEAWLHRIRTGRPFVRVKVALTLDGKPSLAVGCRTRITGPGGAAVTRRLRAGATAVAVGSNTVAVDDPHLTVRDDTGLAAARQPRRIVLARTALPDTASAMFADGLGRVTLVVSDVAPPSDAVRVRDAGLRVLVYAASGGLEGALRALAADGIDDVLIETGPSLFTALWAEGFVDELIVVTAGGMAGLDGPDAFTGSADGAADALQPRFVPVEAGIVEGDAVTVWRPRDAVSPARGKGSGA